MLRLCNASGLPGSPATPTVTDGAQHDTLEILSVHHRVLLLEPPHAGALAELAEALQFLCVNADGQARLRGHDVPAALATSLRLARTLVSRAARLAAADGVADATEVFTGDSGGTNVAAAESLGVADGGMSGSRWKVVEAELCRDFVELWRWLLIDRRGGGPDALLPLVEPAFTARVGCAHY